MPLFHPLKKTGPACFFIGIFFLFILPPRNTWGQEGHYIFRHLTRENGLLSNNVGSIYQDSRGFIWFCTINGLQRYDGSRFITYEMNLKDSEALHSSIVTQVFEDSRHRFWVGTAGGVYQLNRNTGKFYNYNLHLLGMSQTIGDASGFEEDGNGDIWFQNHEGYYKLNNATDQFENECNRNGILENTRPGLITADDKKNIWFVSGNNVTCYDFATRKVLDRMHNPLRKKIFDITQKIATFMVRGNECWFGYANERTVRRYQFSSDSFSLYPIPEPKDKNLQSQNKFFEIRVTYIGTGPQSIIIAGLAGEGIAVYEPGVDKFIPVGINNDDPNGFHADKATYSSSVPFTDRENNIWLPSDHGVNVCNPMKKRFYYYDHSDGIPEYEVSAILQNPADSDIYISLYSAKGGIVRLSKDLKFKKQYLFTNNPAEGGKNQVWCMYLDDKGIIWAPNQSKTVLKLNTRSDELKESRDSLVRDFINIIYKDHYSDLWFCTWGSGLIRLDHTTGKMTSFMTPPPGSTVIPRNIYTLYFDSDSTIWVGTNGSGLLQFDCRQNKFVRQFLFSDQHPESISSNRIFRIIPYHRDTLLIATPIGINVYDKQKNVFGVITTRDGLPNNIVESIILDPVDQLWVACVGGFCKMNMKTWQITKFDAIDGVQVDNFSNVPIFRLSNGIYLAGGEKGFLSFKPSETYINSPPPAPVITGFQVFDKERNTDSLVNTSHAVELKPDEKSIMISFSSLLFNTADKLKYYYRLDGADKNWVLAGPEQAAHYNHLQNGHYTFRVKCINRDGIADQNDTTLKIYIRPPLWKRWWFIAVVMTVFSGLFYALYRFRLQSQARIFALEHNSSKLQKEKAEIEYENLKQQLNPHFLFNSLSSVAGLVQTDPALAEEYILGLTQIYRYVLQSKEQSLVPLSEELQFVEVYAKLQQIRFGSGLQIHIRVAENQQHKKIIPVTLQNLIENAIKHNIIIDNAPLIIDVYTENGFIIVKNNLQKKKFVGTSNKQGLENLSSLYNYLSRKPVEIIADDNFFTIKTPLL